jgi:glutamate N-acetyltransferase / amino-acid N-acetyltransferase
LKLPVGYRYASSYAGIRKVHSDDVALIVPDSPANAAALFTQNMVKAAPVRVATKNLKQSRGKVAALLVNAGNANCATRTGDRVATASCKAAGRALHVPANQVLPASTGVIGVELESHLLTDALPGLVQRLSPDKFEDVARAIMTTDTRMKIASEEITFRGGAVRIAGMTKGSGMIHPNMATTLGFVMTDAEISVRDLRPMLLRANQRSYNSLTVDGDMSTNDTLALLANGASGVKPNEKERRVFEELLTWVLESLAEQIAVDGEGARKLVVVRAVGFRNADDAGRIARTVANSPLVKTAISGSDPNWGRIICAAGYSGVRFDPSDVDIYLQGQLVCKKGLAAPFDEDELKAKLDESEVRIRIAHRANRSGEARIFTCDLTEDYIKINGSYRT